ncbi:MAG TPA: LysM domain-containing protein [Acidimicrobiales bacterium]|nr:LysM domain-containing protein [Acidimicrobiales bacterium]
MAAITHPGLQLPTVTWPSAPRNRPLPASVYRRRRLAVAAVLLGALLSLSWVLSVLGGGSLTAPERGSTPATATLRMAPVASTTHVVEPGDTLWSIARQLVPEGDVRPVVDALAAHRDGRPLQVGERIALP